MKNKLILGVFLSIFLIGVISAAGCSWNFGCTSGGGILKNISQTYVTNYNNVTNYTETDPIWLSQKTNYYTKTQVNDINTSMKNYADSLVVGGYNDAWINGTIDNKILNANTTLYQILMNGSFFNTGGIYDDSWINSTIDNKILINNNSINNRLASLYLINGTNGTNGINGLNGLNGTNGTNGMNGLNGTNGTNGINGLNGTNGTNGISFSNFSLYFTGDNATIQNNSIVNWANSVFASLNTIINAVGNWSADKVNYALLTTLNNGSYLNVPETDSLAYNGTLVSIGILNNGSYLNYLWNATNISYALDSVLMNGSFFNTASSDTFIANYSQFLLNNQSLSNYIVSTNLTTLNILNNGSYKNIAETDSLAYNGTLIDRNTLNNGSYLNPTTTDTFIANYSVFLTHMTMDNATTQNNSLKNYISGTYLTMANATTINDSVKNYILNSNSTLYSILMNGSFFNSASSGISWTTAMNGTLAWMSNLTNYLLISNWNATNGSYMTGDNFTLQNISMKNYVLDVNSTMKIYVDSKGEARWDANYSQFLLNNQSNNNYIVSTNTTLFNILNNGTYKNIAETDSLAYNGTLVPTSILMNGSFFNSATTDTFINNYSTFLTLMTMSNATTQNDSLKNYIKIQNDSMINGDLVLDTTMNTSNNNYIINANTTLYQILMNGSFINSATTDTFIDNYSQFLLNNVSLTNYISSANTTLYQILMNGSFFNSAASITWATIINGTIWSWVMNGTMVKSSELNNGTYVTNLVLNNGSYWNTVDFGTLNNGTIWSWIMNATSEPKWNLNYSQFLLNNVSTSNYIINTNSTLYSIIMNGSFFNSATTDTFIANYSTFLTLMTMSNATTQNQSLINYIATVNTSQTNYDNQQNTSVTNWISNTYNTTRNNEVTRQNTSLVNYIKVQNDSMINGDLVLDTAMNTSMNNFITNVFNVTRNNYILLQNNSLVNYAVATYRSLTNLTLSGGNVNVTAGNLSATGRIQLAVTSCGGMVSGEICRNATGVFIQG